MSAFRDSAIARRRQHLNPLTTALAPVQHFQTPGSTAMLSTPFGYNPASFTPISAVNSYNPRRWDRSSVPGSDHYHRYPSRDFQQEVEAPAPPPYSPPRSNRAHAPSQDEFMRSTNALSLLSGEHTTSPERMTPHVIPPIPNFTPSQDRTPAMLGSSARRQVSSELSWATAESSRDAARRNEPNRFMQRSEDDSLHIHPRPPSSRRAVSASAIYSPSEPTSRSRGSSHCRWYPGMPLPPPPPGPPPHSNRSQSMTRSADIMISPPTCRSPQVQSILGPVPPTPADWVDEDAASRGRSPNRGIVIDTSSEASTRAAGESSSSGLMRSSAVRGEAKSIRERRSESRTGKNNVYPNDVSKSSCAEVVAPIGIVVPNTDPGRRSTITKSSPRSSRFISNSGTPNSGHTSSSNPNSAKTITFSPGNKKFIRTATPVFTQDHTSASRRSIPHPLVLSSSTIGAPTPPFSPGNRDSSIGRHSPKIPPKSLPTPPPLSLLTPPTNSPRSVPHILQIDKSDLAEAKSLSHSRFASQPASRPASSRRSHNGPSSPSDQFSQAAIERHNEFAEKEAIASTDDERVHLFAEFIVSESRIRRDKYAKAIDSMGSEMLELTRDLFRSSSITPRRDSSNSKSGGGWTPESSTYKAFQDPRNAAMHEVPPQNLDPNAVVPPMELPSQIVGKPESNWWTGYMPSLSPIPSMRVSEQYETSSRGRPSSRWWESSQEGSTGVPSPTLQRSKRESKYMGLAKEVRETLQWDSSDPRASLDGEPSSRIQRGALDYPPEKLISHEEDFRKKSSSPGLSCAQSSLKPQQLDISRLITLPPSYPRHHPAVNNNHPDLNPIRAVVRQLSNFSEIQATKERFLGMTDDLRKNHEASRGKRRSALRHNVHSEIENGTMSHADAAIVEGQTQETEEKRSKNQVKAEFELFQSEVVVPLNELLAERINRATHLFEELRSRLFVDAQKHSPNTTQEGGDEEPELLEKLTVLKWIFEGREGLHRELYDLLSDRNARYRDMVVAPYRLGHNVAKAMHATTFFAEDALQRRLRFESEVLGRTEEFKDIIEANVVRGVEVQLSAFWDIAPLLKGLIERIPQDLSPRTFRPQIPAQEMEENPSYAVYPVQYVYSLLSHAEKSTYQFIENQVNLLCLLHEVKSAVAAANCRVMGIQRVQQGEGEAEVESEMRRVEGEEERRLTDDLKEKVRCIEELWRSALGGVAESAMGRCRAFLEGIGGWDEDGSL